MKRWIVCNWKMHGSFEMLDEFVPDFLNGLLEELGWETRIRVVLCPPFPYLPTLASRFMGYPVGVGGQDVFPHAEGAFTGEVSPAMLRDIGVTYCIVGHSERRWHGGETDAQVNEKLLALLAEGIRGIVCVGESLEEREAGRQEEVVAHQVTAAIQGVGEDKLSRMAVAYEPVWAIGTGLTATPEQAGEMHVHIRKLLTDAYGDAGKQVPILYGGSVKADNAASLMAAPEMGGMLIGGASLQPDSLLAIIREILG